mgnify:CR=1 FL=1
MICPNCKGENREDYKFCAHCGAPRQPSPAVTVMAEEPARPPERVLPAAPESPPAAPAETAPPAAEQKPKKKRNCLVTCLVIGVVGLCLAAAALVGVALLKPEWIPFDIPFLNSGNRLVIGVPGSGTESDLYLLRQGKQLDSGLLLAEDVSQVQSEFFYLPQYGMASLADRYYPLAAFIPGQDALLTWYSESGGEITLQRLALSEKTPLTLWQDDATALTGYVLPNAQDLFFSAAQGSGQECYLSRAGEAAERVLDGDTCTLSGDFSTAFATTVEGSETTVQVAALPDAPGYTPLDGQENTGAVSLSGDGARLAYSETGDGQRLLLVNSQDASPVTSGPEAYAIVEQGFAPNGRIGYFIMENNDGNLELYLLSDSGASLVRSALSIAAGMDNQGAHLIYMAGEYDGERALYVRDVSSGSDVEVVRGENLQFQLAAAINRIFITTTQEEETTLYSAAVDGSGLVSLHTCEACQLEGVAYVPGQPYIYFGLTSSQGSSLLAAHLEQASQFMVLEDWANIWVLDTSADGMQLLFAGAEDPNEDSSLYLARLDAGQVTTLDDDADGIANGLFEEKGNAVLYTAITGANPDDVEIRRALTDLSEPVEVLYSDAFLVAAQWDNLSPWYTTQAPLLRQSTSYCPGAYGLGSDETVEGSLEAEARDCYQVRGTAGEEMTLWVEGAADLDTMISLYNRQGDLIDSDDAGFNGTDPRLITSLPEDGIYFVEVSSFGSEAGSYTLSRGAGSNYCPGVDSIALGGELYSANCSRCHGPTGQGKPIAPALNVKSFLTETTDQAMQQIIPLGVPGTAMPAWGDRMTEAEIQAIVGFIRQWEATAPEVAQSLGLQGGGGPPWLRNQPTATAVQPAEGVATPTPLPDGDTIAPTAQATHQPGADAQGQGQGQASGGTGGPPRSQATATPQPSWLETLDWPVVILITGGLATAFTLISMAVAALKKPKQ